MNSLFLLPEATTVFAPDVVRAARRHPAIVHFGPEQRDEVRDRFGRKVGLDRKMIATGEVGHLGDGQGLAATGHFDVENRSRQVEGCRFSLCCQGADSSVRER